MRIGSRISLVCFLTLIQTELVFSVENEEEFMKRCPPFQCGKLGIIRFPFAKSSEDFSCGPFVVDDCDKEVPKAKLRESNKWYQLHNISEFQLNGDKLNNVTITDTDLQRQFKSKDCQSFNQLNPILLQFPGYVHLPKYIELIKCNHSLDQVHSPHYENEYKECPNFHIYYNNTIQISSQHTQPPNCIIVPLAVNPNMSFKSHHNIFELLTATFSFQVFISVECYLCPPKDGECQKNTAGKWRCLNHSGKEIAFYPPQTKHGKNNGWQWKVALGSGSAAFLLCLVLIFFWYRYKRTKHDPSNINRPNAYSAAFSKSDLEGANIYFGVSIFSYTELEEATNCFALENELGDGGFGTVYYGKLKDGREVAVKRLYERNYKKVNQFLNEIEILTHLRHTNLVSLYGCTSRRSRELLLVYDYIPNGTLADHLHGNRTNPCLLTWPIRMRIAVETASALVYLHASGIVHRDVKTNNILLDDHYCVKVADFGISRLFPSDVTHISTAPQGTPGYVDPEYFQCYQLTDKSDVFSFGVVLAELISSMPAVDMTRHRHEINLANLAVNRIQTCAFDEFIDPLLGYKEDEEVKRMVTSVAELAFLCLQQDKEMRPVMFEVLHELQRIENRESQIENLGEVYEDMGKSSEISRE